jgi:hypothetical protein
LYKHLFLEYAFSRVYIQQVVNCMETEFCGEAVKFSLSLSLSLPVKMISTARLVGLASTMLLKKSENTFLVS